MRFIIIFLLFSSSLFSQLSISVFAGVDKVSYKLDVFNDFTFASGITLAHKNTKGFIKEYSIGYSEFANEGYLSNALNVGYGWKHLSIRPGIKYLTFNQEASAEIMSFIRLGITPTTKMTLNLEHSYVFSEKNFHIIGINLMYAIVEDL